MDLNHNDHRFLRTLHIAADDEYSEDKFPAKPEIFGGSRGFRIREVEPIAPQPRHLGRAIAFVMALATALFGVMISLWR